MLCFVPVIIVLRGARVRAAIDDSLGFWARHGKNAIVFVVASALVLMIPEILQDLSGFVLPHFGYVRRAMSLALTLLKAALGALIFCSLVAFYNGLENEEESEKT